MNVRPLLHRVRLRAEPLIRRRILTRDAKLAELKRAFHRRNGYEPNLDEPRTFNEKLLWYKLFYRDRLMVQCADKIAMRRYVSTTIGDGHTPQLFGVWDKARDIDFDALPERFVLKYNGGAGANLVCTSKAELDREAAIEVARSWLEPKANFYLASYEWVYRDIPPRLLAEELLETPDGDLHDYKIFCFEGQARFAYVTSHYDGVPHADYYDIAGQVLPFQRLYPRSPEPPPLPPEWSRLVAYAEKLARPFPHVRVDFYVVEGRILVGELTFYSGSAVEPISPDSWDERLGQWWTLPARARRLPLAELLPY